MARPQRSFLLVAGLLAAVDLAGCKSETPPQPPTLPSETAAAPATADSPESGMASGSQATVTTQGAALEAETPGPTDPDQGFVRIAAGSFAMGSPEEEHQDFSREGPVHTVEITAPFWLMEAPVTTGEWAAIMGNRPSDFAESCGDDCPVERVNWWEALSYANRRSEALGLESCYLLEGCQGTLGDGERQSPTIYTCQTAAQVPNCSGYRLPTEAEWEYAARAGTNGATWGHDPDAPQASLDRIAWNLENSGRKTHPVRAKEANPWGLYDIIGNVFEWVWDGFTEDYYAASPATDPQGPAVPDRKVLRGGAWFSPLTTARSAYRLHAPPERRFNSCGFRLARSIPADTPGT